MQLSWGVYAEGGLLVLQCIVCIMFKTISTIIFSLLMACVSEAFRVFEEGLLCPLSQSREGGSS